MSRVRAAIEIIDLRVAVSRKDAKNRKDGKNSEARKGLASFANLCVFALNVFITGPNSLPP